jgi:hypothetical protein
MSACRIIRSVHPVTIDLTDFQFWEKAMPDLVSSSLVVGCERIRPTNPANRKDRASTLVACSEKSAKLTPLFLRVAPSGEE